MQIYANEMIIRKKVVKICKSRGYSRGTRTRTRKLNSTIMKPRWKPTHTQDRQTDVRIDERIATLPSCPCYN